MEIIRKENIESFSLPLPIYQTIHIADAVNKDGEKFKILVGLDEELVRQLKKYSLDESDGDLQNNTKDRERFGVGSYESWYEKNRTPFALVHSETNTLAALVWFGPKPLHEGCKCHSLGWRSYNPFRGKGVMKDFAKFAMDFYLEKVPNTKLWAAIKSENIGSYKLSEALGFKKSEQYSNNTSIVMTSYYD